ncbi:putative PhzF superfamily epimerase YddE/YHI9 [Kibdelosporangium banguiense]|uniref:PhzF superfamily epimerase YddE/YHI9 n=1 Tax=Kibdelosporangium banguiense TaxID=1365924 RepID=A0ABS4TMV2_9PSEU|nr:PhzF family phenazine biosynthesis isomerase [Kibdelosporangium banguiense]MBP2325743.1 putative PhzF superfamily epimerase YddE/YHI9 [Kibdelosporangium banguiense]
MRILYQVDAFTTTPFTGNAAGVVLEAQGMTDAEMLAVARELNNSETAFVLPADAADHDVRVRFFTPTTEVPTCGHATVAAHFTRAVEYGLPSGSLAQKTGSGPIQIVSTGHSKVLVELRDHAAVDTLRPDPAALTALSHEVGSNGFFVFTRATGDASLLTWSRMFAPAIGIVEDPVTGNGHGPLGAYLVRHGLVPALDGKLSFTGRQGEAMGRPGDVRVTVETRPGDELHVSITGDAATAFRAELAVPRVRS